MLDLGLIQVHLMLNHLPVLGVPFGFGLLAFVALGGLLVSRSRTLPSWFGMGTLIGALLVSGLMVWTANLGGKVGHEELRSGELGGASADLAPVAAGRWTDVSPLLTP